jgi:hypothetical protein
MNNTRKTTKTRTLGIVIILLAAAAVVITGTYAATTQQASASSPCSHLIAIKGGKIACSTVEQKAKIDQQQSVNDDDDKSNDANDRGRSYDATDDASLDVTQTEEASIYQFALSSASVN